MEDQYFADFDPVSQSNLQIVLQKTISGMKYALLIAGLALVSFVLVSLVSIILNVFHLFHTQSVLPRVQELEASPGYMLYPWFIVACAGVLAVLLVIRWSVEPIRILRYLRQLKRDEKQNTALYFPLKASPAADPTGETYTGRGDQFQEMDLMAWAQQQHDKHLFLLGPRGSGKTMFLHFYQGNMLHQLRKIIFGQQRIPVFVSMGTYNNSLEDELVDFLHERVPEMQHLRRYLRKMVSKGRLLLLCDDIHKISSSVLDAVCGHLIGLMNETRNQLIITCRQIDYLEHQHIQELVTKTEGKTVYALIDPLPRDQVEPFIHRYVEQQSDTWRHGAEQIFQIINMARLIPLCTNPSSVRTLMQIIDKADIDGGHVLDTRGLLLQDFVLQRIDTELEGEWNNVGLTKGGVLQVLSELAYAMRWVSDRNEVDLSLSLQGEGSLDYEVLAKEILYWLDDQQAQEPFVGNQDVQPGLFYDSLRKRERALLLQFARSIDLITIRPEGILSFKHKIIADYLVARYLYFLTEDSRRQTLLPLNEAFLSDETIERWHEPFALWVGLIEDPAPLIDRIAYVGQRDQRYAAPALMLSLVCLGAKQKDLQQEVHLPPSLRQMLVDAVANKNTRKMLARVFDRYATENENGVWVYRTLFLLLNIEGVEHLMVLLKNKSVPKMLFQYLALIADDVRFNVYGEPLIRMLRQFGSQENEDVILMAAELSKPAPQRNLQLRKAAIGILGYTQDRRAVEPLIILLQDSQAEIRDASSHALAQLGPRLVLDPLIKGLRAGSLPCIPVLGILNVFLTTQRQEFQLKDVEYQEVLEALVPVLSSKYPQEAREGACELLKKLVQSTTGETKQSREKLVVVVLQGLGSEDKALGNNIVEVLREVGEFATPYLLERLLHHQLEPIARRRIVEVFSYVRDQRALEALLLLVADPSDVVFNQVKFALQHYARQYPECIIGLIKLVLDNNNSNEVADRAAEILGDLGDDVVEPVIEAMSAIKYRRTEKLVHVLEKRRDERAIPALINLLNMPQVRDDTSLVQTVISALGEFRDERVVSPLLEVLASSDNELCDKAIDVLSSLGEIAFYQLIDKLNVQQETAVTPRIRQALIRMKTPLDRKFFYVDEELFKIISTCGDELALQIRFVFRERGFDAAQVLIRHISDPDKQVRERVLLMLYAMDRSYAIPAFVIALRHPLSELDPELFSIATQYLTQDDDSIPSLVSALRYPQSDAISTILLKFGPKLLQSKEAMKVGLNDVETKERLQHIIKTSGLERPQVVVPQIIDLFSLIKDKNQDSLAYTALVELLAGDLAEKSIHYLIKALDKTEVIDGVADALERLAGRLETRDEVINGLIQSLRLDTRRSGPKVALVRLGDKAVYPVGDLIADNDPSVALAAQEILTGIGIHAFPVIWSALSDKRNTGRQDAGRNILCAMPTDVIKIKLVELLSSPKAADIEMAVTLLLELMQNEARRPAGSQRIIPALLASIQAKSPEHTKLRILTLLLLWGGSNVAESLVQTLRSNPQLDEQLAQALLLLRKETAGKVLQDVVQDKTGALSPALRAQLAGVLGMIKPELVSDYAMKFADYGLDNGDGRRVKNPDQLAVSLRALGALLANGSWNIVTIHWMREHAEAGTPQRELFDILLGVLYSPRINAEQEKRVKAEGELHTEKGLRSSVEAELKLTKEALRKAIEDKEGAEAARDRAIEEARRLWINQQVRPGTGGSMPGPGTPPNFPRSNRPGF